MGVAFFFFLLCPLYHFVPQRASEGRDSKRGSRRSAEVTSRPGFALQLRCRGHQLCSVKAGQTRSSWEGEGGGGAGFDLGDWRLRYWEGTLEEDEMGRIMSMEGAAEGGIRPTEGKDRFAAQMVGAWQKVGSGS
jgi:hypothetical protein